MRCGICNWKYPEMMLNQAFINGRYTPPICGLCALAAINEVTGVNRKSFQGEMAEANRLSAIEWREKHPNDAPTTH